MDKDSPTHICFPKNCIGVSCIYYVEEETGIKPPLCTFFKGHTKEIVPEGVCLPIYKLRDRGVPAEVISNMGNVRPAILDSSKSCSCKGEFACASKEKQEEIISAPKKNRFTVENLLAVVESEIERCLEARKVVGYHETTAEKEILSSLILSWSHLYNTLHCGIII